MTEKTGTDVMREAIAVRIKRKDYGRVANAIGVHGDRLIEFAEGRRDLSPDIKKKLAVELFHAEWDQASDLMMPANRTPPKPLRSAYPQPVTGDPNWVKPEYTIGPQPAVKVKPKPKPSRPGWLGGLFQNRRATWFGQIEISSTPSPRPGWRRPRRRLPIKRLSRSARPRRPAANRDEPAGFKCPAEHWRSGGRAGFLKIDCLLN